MNAFTHPGKHHTKLPALFSAKQQPLCPFATFFGKAPLQVFPYEFWKIFRTAFTSNTQG